MLYFRAFLFCLKVITSRWQQGDVVEEGCLTRAASTPPMMGMAMSMSTQSKGRPSAAPRLTASTPSWPLQATSQTMPSTVSIFFATVWFMRLSSASSTRRPCAPNLASELLVSRKHAVSHLPQPQTYYPPADFPRRFQAKKKHHTAIRSANGDYAGKADCKEPLTKPPHGRSR